MSRMVTEAARRLRQTYEALACGVLVCTGAGDLVDANAAALRLLGLDRASLSGPRILADLRLQEPDGAPVALDARPGRMVQQTGQEERGRLLGYLRPDGQTRSLLVDTVPLHDAQGAIAQIIISFVDVTDLQMARAAQQASEDRYRRIVETAHEGIWELDAEDRTVYVNRRLAGLLGYTADEMVGQPVSAFLAPPTSRAVQAALAAKRAGQAGEGEACYRRKDGSLLWARLAANPLFGADGQYSGALALVTDISAHKEAERALQASERYFRALTEHASDLVTVIDEQGRIGYVSPSYRTMLGHEPAALTGTDPAALVHADDVTDMAAEIAALVRDPDHVARLTLHVRHADGGWRVVEYRGVNRLDDPDVRGIVATGRDITAQYAAEQARAQSEQYFRALSEHTQDLVIVFDPVEGLRYVSPSFTRVLGYQPAALERGRGQLLDLTHPDDQALMQRLMGDVLTEPNRVASAVLREQHADGTWRSIEWIGINRSDDPVVQGVLVTGRDVTARVRMEAALAAVASENSLFAAAIAALDTGVVITDAQAPDQPIVFCNAGFTALTGYAQDDVLGRNCRFLQGPATTARVRAEIAAALAAGRPYRGIVRNYRHDGTPFWNELVLTPIHDQKGGLTHYVGLQTNVSGRIQLEQELQYQARHDALTGAPSRTLIQERGGRALAASQRTGQPLALLLLDLDRFKEVNDACGHPTGDLLLQQVARRLHDVAGAGTTLGRLGGDEFALLLTDADADAAQQAAARVIEALEDPFMVEGQALYVGVSIGIALAPAHGADLATLLRHADMAMYAAKRGRSGPLVYAPEHDHYTPARLSLIADLRTAIAQGMLCLHYQPKMELATGAVTRVEALVRWPHPEQGLIPPDRFIPLAEQTGLIGPLTQWVLEEALHQCADWRRAGYSLGVNVNLSATNLCERGLPAVIAGLLHTYDVSAGELRLEVTESALIADMARSERVLADLAALGVRVAIDDYGTGYSSLAYLKRLPIDELKIDKSFVRDLLWAEVDATIVASTIGLGHSLGLRVVAEGAEDSATVARLAAMGCDAVQGYVVSRPLPASDVAPWLQARRRTVA